MAPTTNAERCKNYLQNHQEKYRKNDKFREKKKLG